MLSRSQAARLALAQTRSYAISVKPGRTLPALTHERVFGGKKAFQYNWYTRMLDDSQTCPLILLRREDFTAERLKKLRVDLNNSVKKLKSPPSLQDGSTLQTGPPPPPSLTIIHSSIFGVALRNHPSIKIPDIEQMTSGIRGGYAVLSLPCLSPPYLSAVLSALAKSVPPRPPKTPEELKKEADEKKADPANPGRRMKRSRPIRTPDVKVLGAIMEGRVLLPEKIDEVKKLPELQDLRAQIVGLLSAPSSQIAAVLSQASGGALYRTLEGFKKGLEDQQNGPSPDA
jgi:ribosomal protein L10